MPSNDRAREIVRFWLGGSQFGPDDFEQHSKLWYDANPDTDNHIRETFGHDLTLAENGELDSWASDATGVLALVVLLDQFSRNLYRGSADAFKNDKKAQDIVTRFVDSGEDSSLSVPARLLLYHPFLHAEDKVLQARVVNLHQDLLRQSSPEWHPIISRSARYSEEHAEVVYRFGRFPHRNRLLDRDTTPEEAAFLEKDPRSYGQGKGQG